jgi:hypothetical protein
VGEFDRNSRSAQRVGWRQAFESHLTGVFMRVTRHRPIREAAVVGPAERLAALDTASLDGPLDQDGYAPVPGLLDASGCAAVAALYDDPARFRSRVIMSRHGYGSGEYRYFGYPLPRIVQALRATLYEVLVPVANRWHERMGSDVRFPATHPEFLARCHASGQAQPTCLLLSYGAGDYNCLHQDLYGEHVFPLQMAVLLSRPGIDFEGGEFVMTEQRPRMQSRPLVVALGQGDAVIFAVRYRPVRGTRGSYRVNLRHGVSRIQSGSRRTLGVILHDAR